MHTEFSSVRCHPRVPGLANSYQGEIPTEAKHKHLWPKDSKIDQLQRERLIFQMNQKASIPTPIIGAESSPQQLPSWVNYLPGMPNLSSLLPWSSKPVENETCPLYKWKHTPNYCLWENSKIIDYVNAHQRSLFSLNLDDSRIDQIFKEYASQVEYFILSPDSYAKSFKYLTVCPNIKTLVIGPLSLEQMQSVTKLNLSKVTNLSYFSQLQSDPECVSNLFNSPLLQNLTHMNVKLNSFSKYFPLLLASQHLKNLTHLDISSNIFQFANDNLTQLSQSSIAPQLIYLNINMEMSTSEDKNLNLKLLNNLTNLISIDIGNNKCDAAGIEHLAKTLQKVEHFNASGCTMNYSCLEKFVEYFNPNLKSLNLAGNPFSDLALSLFAKARFNQLEELILDGNQVGAPGIGMLTSATFAPHLKNLSLDSCQLNVKAIKNLTQDHRFPNLKKLSLDNCCDNGGTPIGDKGIELIFNSTLIKNITDLSLMQIGATTVGAKKIAESQNCLSSLNIGWNDIFDEGVDAIAKSKLFQQNLKYLGVSYCQTHNESAELIAAMPWEKLTTLSLDLTSIDDTGKKALDDSKYLTNCFIDILDSDSLQWIF